MLRLTLSLVASVILLEVVSCVNCPDGTQCPDKNTCCQSMEGYLCCPYPDAVCCSDKAHCCPLGYACNLAAQVCEKQNLPWLKIPMVMEKAESPLVIPAFLPREFENSHGRTEETSSAVHCDDYYQCPDGTTCCKNTAGTWSCCPYSPGSCCLDGLHCCPIGYHCDAAYRNCVKQGMRFPFTAREQLPVVSAALLVTPEKRSGILEKPLTPLTELAINVQEARGINCDSTFICPMGMTCCKGPQGQWSCCPFQLGQCCADSQHCCEYGYTCSSSSLSCKKSSQ